MSRIDEQMVNSIRVLSMDMIEKANSGHPGLPMGAAPMAFSLWKNHLKFNPEHPTWFNRDRFVLSAGHGSAMLYSLLHLFGYDLPMSELKNFRQTGSKTPGHPEFGHTVGVDATTGPLGQGFAMGVGMAMAEAHLGAKFNQPEFPVVDHNTYVLCGDGCLMEGISYEAASLAGHLKLGKLVVLYDSNDISLDGDLNESFSEDIELRFRAAGWQTLRVDDGNDLDALDAAIHLAKTEKSRPTLIEVKTVIGYGSPGKAGKSAAHGSPLGEKELKLAKEAYDWQMPPFELPKTVENQKEFYHSKGRASESSWLRTFNAYKQKYPALAESLQQLMDDNLDTDWNAELPVFDENADKPVATREVSGTVLQELEKKLPNLFGGAADLASSNKTHLKASERFAPGNYAAKNISFGVREFAMGAAVNGMTLHGGVQAFGATFFVFSDYLRSAIRSAALMGIPSTFIMTHDSIAVGEDGPTHEPIEHLASFRAMPGLHVIRPADGNETVEAYRFAFTQKEQPTMLVLSRQNLPILPNSAAKAKTGLAKGAYILADSPLDKLDIILLASGSEVHLMTAVRDNLAKKGFGARVVSMPSFDLFDKQSTAYKESILPKAVKKRFAAEMGASYGWHKYLGDTGEILAIDSFGMSGPGDELAERFGFTVENLTELALKQL
ncbi:transketolase [Listeria monocytogenes]|nr:transketolase [Listeria monocytogenes]EGU0986732.1 transketolase [Listeria monocytogenes]EHD1634765.1 transketolase [Listeria monocytogenes]EHD1763448.1 transketolase [Listeria monocytogenes]